MESFEMLKSYLWSAMQIAKLCSVARELKGDLWLGPIEFVLQIANSITFGKNLSIW
jgi:hypothetical protein